MEEVLGKQEQRKEKEFNIGECLKKSEEEMKERQKLITELKNPKRIRREYFSSEHAGQKP